MGAPEFNIQSNVADGVHRLSVVGELDLATAPDLARRIDAAGKSGRVAVDLSGVTFIDGSGVRILLAAHERFNRDGGPGLELGPASRPVRRLLEITGLGRPVGSADRLLPGEH